MNPDLLQSTHAFSALGHELRLKLFRLLLERVQEGMNAGELSREFDISPSNLSFHLAQLTKGGLIVARREKRNTIYTVNISGLQALVHFLTSTCCGHNPNLCGNLSPRETPVRVLFLCSGNSARSIMAEALLNSMSGGKMCAYSAGAHPFGGVHPYALDLLRQHGLATWELRSKSWKEFTMPGGAEMNVIITTCAAASEDICPLWPGNQPVFHWDIADPVQVEGSENQRRKAFAEVFVTLKEKIRDFLDQPLNYPQEKTV